MLTVILPALLALAPGPAQAGEIYIEAPITMIVKVEGIARDFEPAASSVVVRNLKTGSFQVEIVNAFGKLKAQELVAVDAAEVVRLKYSKRALTELGRGPLVEGSKVEGSTSAAGVGPGLQQAADTVEKVAEDVATELRTAAGQVGTTAQGVANTVDEKATEAVEQVREEVSGSSPPEAASTDE